MTRLDGPPLLDHVVVATPDLAAAVAMIAEATGVELEPGGVHPTMGTRNFLATFGDGTYLELIGADTANTGFTGTRPFRIDEVSRTQTSSWAAAPGDLEDAIARLRAAGVDLGPASAGSRQTDDGRVLRWQLTAPLAEPTGVIPFLIDWGATTTPAHTITARLERLELRATHPRPEWVAGILGALGTSLPVAIGEPGLELTIRGPGGTLTV